VIGVEFVAAPPQADRMARNVLYLSASQMGAAVTLIELAITSVLMIADAWVWTLALSFWVP
jgi:hypothetical protein